MSRNQSADPEFVLKGLKYILFPRTRRKKALKVAEKLFFLRQSPSGSISISLTLVDSPQRKEPQLGSTNYIGLLKHHRGHALSLVSTTDRVTNNPAKGQCHLDSYNLGL